MRERFRSFDSKISFFAFADIITAVSGMIIFITLLLATDLGRPSEGSSRVEDSEVQGRLQETLSQQAEVDAQNQSLQGVLAAAETAPSVEKLESDIERLRGQLMEEKRKHTDLAEQIAVTQSASDSRDRTLGLTDLKNQIQQVVQEAESIALQAARVRDEMTGVEQRVASVQSKLLKLREREGKLWLIPDKNSTTKEPILAVLSGSAAKMERFDHPEQARQFNKSSASAGFESYLGELKPLNQYVVFQVRPSGIELFERLVKIARDKGFEVGFDAIEEQGEIHFATPPPLDEPPVQTKPSDAVTVTNADPSVSSPASPAQTNVTPTAAPATKQVSASSAASTSVPAPKTKSWWRRFLEFIGLG
jgi:hypothetical protein